MLPIFFKEENKYGLKSSTGITLASPKYESVRTFVNGLAAVSYIEQLPSSQPSSRIVWTYIDLKGKEMNQKFEFAPDFYSNAVLANVYLHSKCYLELVDKKGNLYYHDTSINDYLAINYAQYTKIGFGLYGVYEERRNGVRSSSTRDCYSIVDTNTGETIHEWKTYLIGEHQKDEQVTDIVKQLTEFKKGVHDFFESAHTKVNLQEF